MHAGSYIASYIYNPRKIFSYMSDICMDLFPFYVDIYYNNLRGYTELACYNGHSPCSRACSCSCKYLCQNPGITILLYQQLTVYILTILLYTATKLATSILSHIENFVANMGNFCRCMCSI